MKNNKGITMISLTVTIIIMVMLTGIVTVNVKKHIDLKNVNKLYADIENISSKISEYYLKNEELPIYGTKYVNSKTELIQKFIQNTGDSGNISDNLNKNDADDGYYVINLSKLDNLTLNYGSEFAQWQDPQKYDYYIINTVTHQIYYPYGIQLSDEYYFTRYPDDQLITPVEMQRINDSWSVSIIGTPSKTDMDNNNISISADVSIILTQNYDSDSMEYAWTDNVNENESNLNFTKFKPNTSNNYTFSSRISSKPIDKTKQNVYLWIGVMDINGDFHYTHQNVVLSN